MVFKRFYLTDKCRCKFRRLLPKNNPIPFSLENSNFFKSRRNYRTAERSSIALDILPLRSHNELRFRVMPKLSQQMPFSEKQQESRLWGPGVKTGLPANGWDHERGAWWD